MGWTLEREGGGQGATTMAGDAFKCASDRQLAKGVWIPGTLETLGAAGLRWEATGVEDPNVRAKLEDTVRSKAGGGDAAKAFRLDIALEDIVGPPQRSKPPTKPLMRLQIAPQSSSAGGGKKTSCVFRFLSDQSRDTVIDVIQPLLAKLRKAPAGGAGQPGGSSDPFASVSGTNVREKRKLLLKNTELGDLYKEVVSSGAVTDQEFWMTKRKLLEKEMASSATSAQKRGVSSSMLADVELTNDGKSFVINFKLTEDFKKHIFAEKPKVYKAYLMNVPSKLSEKDFWTKYCRHLYYQKSGTRKRKQTSVSGMGKSIEEAEEREAVTALFTESGEEIKRTRELKEKKAKSIDPSIDLTADYHDALNEGYGLRHNAAGVIAENKGHELKTSKLVKDLNRHAAVVVCNAPEASPASAGQSQAKATTGGGDAPANGAIRPRAQAQVLEDLVASAEEDHEALRVQSLHQRENGAGAAAGVSFGGAEMVRRLMAEVESAGSSAALTSAGEERRVVGDLDQRTRLARSRTKMLRSAVEGSEDAPQVKEMVSKLKSLSLAVNELLRHFWASFPLTSQQRRDKAKRIKKHLIDQYDKIESVRKTLDPATRQMARPIIGPLLQACDAAFTKADASLDE